MNRAEVPIAEPCSADWSTMTLADRGRFCGACRKVVRELTQMTEAEARALLASPPTEGLCVRYVHDTTGEIVFRRDIVPLDRLARVKRAAITALAAAALPLAAAGCMGAPQTHPLMGAPPAPDPSPMTMGAVSIQPPPAAPSAPTDSPEATPKVAPSGGPGSPPPPSSP